MTVLAPPPDDEATDPGSGTKRSRAHVATTTARASPRWSRPHPGLARQGRRAGRHAETTLWEAICRHYYEGVESVARMRQDWDALRGLVDEARWWRNACVLYFQTFAKRPLPERLAPPAGTLEEYMAVEHRHVPGI